MCMSLASTDLGSQWPIGALNASDRAHWRANHRPSTCIVTERRDSSASADVRVQDRIGSGMASCPVSSVGRKNEGIAELEG